MTRKSTLMQKWNDSGLLRQHLAARYGNSIIFGGSPDRLKRARLIANRIAKLTGMDRDEVWTRAAEDYAVMVDL